ncbi:RNA dependent RNA polymerase [Sporobolomyces salmoneus]|uniref:RNA dependent RNA polymerase n=1 Tax=Sporobolomyces salmoneus TaxID=183962 RepID=UPI00316EB30F
MQSSCFPSRTGGGEVLDLTLSITPEPVLVLSDGAEEVRDPDVVLVNSSRPRTNKTMRRPDLRRAQYSSSSTPPAKEEPLSIEAVAFGGFSSSNSFSTEWEHLASSRDRVSFEESPGREKKQVMVVQVGSNEAGQSKKRIIIELANVVHIQQASGGKSFYFHLRLPPRFELSDGSPKQRPRQVPSFDADHARVAPYSSKVVRIRLRDSRAVPLFRERAERRSLPRIVSSKIVLDSNRRMGKATLDKVSSWISKLDDIPVAFQIEKLLRNGLVDPLKLLGLRGKIEDIFHVQGSINTERILDLFADSLVKLEDLSQEKTAVEIVLTDDEEAEKPGNGIESTSNVRKRRQALVPQDNRSAALFRNRNEEEEEEEDDDDDSDDDVILPPSFLPARSRPSNPNELSINELQSLLSHAVTRSVAFASLYASCDPTKLVRQVTITPTGFVLGGPSLESSNSIVRRYGRPAHFLRVAVRNEDGTLLDKDASDIVASKFKPLFQTGFELGGKKWEFLAWSASGLKAGACFFVSPFEKDGVTYTPEAIHRDIGDFKGDPTAQIPAKYFARISQAFTSSRPSIDLQPHQITVLPDLVSRTGSLFSDGVGTISPSLARQVVRVLELDGSGKQNAVTCFQIRLGGAKGMLQVDPQLEGKKISLRPSQIKFKSQSTSLSIAATFTAQPAFLNRPLIKLLEDLGISTEALIKLQKNAMAKVRKARKKLSSAIRLLDDWNLSRSSRLSTTLAFLDQEKTTSKAAFQNPFVSQLLDAVVTHVSRDIKYKSRIPIPGSYNLVGVVDIENTLEEDEIYAPIQLPDGTTKYLEGTIGISRSPTNHTGDLQLVTAVGGLPEGRGNRIRGLSNCVVFSAKGDRSLPSKLAGGDLDGDLYLLLTQESGLLPSFENLSSPAAYDAAEPTRLDRDVTLKDGVDFFFEYPSSDMTALVATRQLLLADFYSEGLFHPDCLKLAQLHSDCVDYVKSGTPVSPDEIPKIPFEMKERGGRPDFASFPGGQTYASPRTLGQLYRAIDPDLITPPILDTSSVDPNRALTQSLLSLKLRNGSRLPTKPPRELVDHFKTYTSPFCSELGKLANFSHPPIQEEELFLHVTVNHKIDRSAKNVMSNRGERVDELFRLVGDQIAGKDGYLRAWSAWIAFVETDEEHSRSRAGSEQKGKFGLRSLAFLALGVLAERLKNLDEVEVIVID